MKTAEHDFDIGKLTQDMAIWHASIVDGVVQTMESHYRPAIEALGVEFRKALSDPETKMKSSLQVAICAVLARAGQ